MSDPTRCGSIDALHLEITSKCNLRCVYCGKSLSAAESRRKVDLDEGLILQTVSALRALGLRAINASGIGETTIRPDWTHICDSLLDTTLTLTIITNLARPLSWEEASTLARFWSVQVSIDTCDPLLFSKIRRGAQLDVITKNIQLIAEAARHQGLSPVICFDMVVSDKTIFDLEKTVRFGLQLGVREFLFADLYKIGATVSG